MKVVKEWKGMLGQDWEKTYGVTNSLYVTRQNNILYFGNYYLMDYALMGGAARKAIEDEDKVFHTERR
jgi:hypothetical protein